LPSALAAHLAAATCGLGLALLIAVNLSPKQLQRPGIEAALLAACERGGVSLRMLELTQSALLRDGMELMRLLRHSIPPSRLGMPTSNMPVATHSHRSMALSAACGRCCESRSSDRRSLNDHKQ
jgi:hypothetical protein